MRTAGWLRATVLLLAAVHVLGFVLGAPLVPWSGALTLLALLGYAFLGQAPSGRVRRPLLAGLAALTAAAALVDGRDPLAGWPIAVPEPAAGRLSGAMEAVLLSGAAVGLAVALLRAAGRPSSRRARAAVVTGGGLAATACAYWLWSAMAEDPQWYGRPDGLNLAIAALPLVCAAVLGALAVGAAWVAGGALRGVGVALAPVVGLALAAVYTVSNTVTFYVPPSRFSADTGTTLDLSRAADGWVWQETIVELRMVDPVEQPAVVVRTEEPVQLWPGLWPDDFWTADLAWADLVPAAVALLCLLGVVAVVAALAGDPPQERGVA